ncbi:hypothetical protein D3C72_249120 [compost metagenome]
MTEPAEPKSQESAGPETGARWTVLGVGISAVWLIGLGVYACLNWEGVLALKPNEVGDALAGAFAPLAFLWLVLGFFQQGAELRNSGRALRLQGEELKNSVEQQRELVAVTREQLLYESQKEEGLRRSAQPILELVLGPRISSGGVILGQKFVLSNHGRECTGVVINFFGCSRSTIRFDNILSTEPREFTIKMDDKIIFPVQIQVRYIDGILSPGSKEFIFGEFDGGYFIDEAKFKFDQV